MLREVKLKSDEGRRGYLGGISHRVWMLIGGCLGLMLFSRLLFPSTSTPTTQYTSTSSLLTAKDYLNASATDPAPFDFCPVFGPGDYITARRGQVPLLRSRIHTGTGARVQRVVQKAMAGLPISISVLGGSVSACHGAGDDVVAPRCWPARFFDWWNSVFPHPASELTNGAQRKTDSSYFAYCSAHHLPDKTDLIILEFDADDPNDPTWMNHFELLVRSLLVRPEQPAVILLGHFAPQLQSQNGFAGPELLHGIVAQYYDVPHISAKGAIYFDYLLEPEGIRDAYFADPVLAKPEGHQLLADLLTSYFMSQICAGWATTLGHAFDVPYMGAPESDSSGSGGPGSGLLSSSFSSSAEDLANEGGGLVAKQRAIRVPKARLHDRPSDILKFREVAPFCVSANDLINPLPPSHLYGSGWKAHHPTKGASSDEKHYWYAEVAGSKMRVPVTLSAGDVAIYYLQNPEDKPLGRAACWVDDNYAGRVELSGHAPVGDTTVTLTMIDEGVSPGSHYVECQLLGPVDETTAPFKMLGVFAT